jgi:glutaredoxin 3
VFKKSIKEVKDRLRGHSDEPVAISATAQPIVMYSTRFCPYCMRARGLLQSKGWDYQDIPVDGDQGLRSEMMQKSGQHTVPQIWIGDQHIGGCDELFRLEVGNQLEAMVMGENQ